MAKEQQPTREELIRQSGELIGELRKKLKSISLKDLKETEEPQLTDAEYNERANAAEIFFKNYMEKIIDILEHRQLIELGTRAQNDIQMVFCRGTINGLYLIKEWFLEQVNVSQARFEPKGEVEPGEEI